LEKRREAEGRCPVCLRRLTPEQAERLRGEAEEELRRVEEELERLRERERGLKEERDRVEAELERARDRRGELRQGVRELEERLEEAKRLKGLEAYSLLDGDLDRIRKACEVVGAVKGWLRELDRLEEGLERKREEREELLRRLGEVLGERPGDVDEAGRMVKELRERRDRLEEELRKVQEDVQEYERLREKVEREKELRDKLRGLRERRSELEERLRELEEERDELVGKWGSLEDLEERMERVREDYERARDELRRCEGRLEGLRKEREGLEREVRRLRRAERECRALESLRGALELAKEGFKYSRDVAREALLPVVEREASRLLEALSDRYGSLRIEGDGERIRALAPGGYLIDADRMSGGEKVIIGLALRLALAMVGSNFAPFIMLDEPTEHLDSEHRERLAQALRELRLGEEGRIRQAIVVTHDEELEEAADTLWRIENVGGRSEVSRETPAR
jgi:exonuclease SbcC